ncbi:acyltransferase family protein [Pectobacterium wasabiae]|uniref:Acyltransferase n=1 Tax=Pectobacterium wasabiae TaxID=55208 RepID=A0AAW3EED8_9GAMM|nr:acyltransferase [Pectobacterium wasabiae]AOR63094.1 acyltransferase [Pectobacterium wasabiae CFBP 3304]EJS92140.1 Acyltransferase family 3 protein [Pectobacterium wasabiae CFBP 3304]KFX03654.1 acyltransferase [Pectobacterium wasabiae]KGA27005.1 acyltransferase [Pectobacterium wasabiae]
MDSNLIVKKDNSHHYQNNIIIKRTPKGYLPNLPSLNGTRIIAALLVYLFHTSSGNMLNLFSDDAIGAAYIFILSKAGWVSVSFFFILSGFVMNWSTPSVSSPLQFYRKRFAKVYPVNIFIIILLIFTGIISVGRVDVWLPNLLLIQTWIPQGDIYIGGNVPSWFLSVIVFLYIIYPFLLKIVKKIPTESLWTSVILCYIALIAVNGAIYTLLPTVPVIEGWPHVVGEIQWWLSYTFPPTRIFEFTIGMLLSRIIQEGKWIPVSVTTSIILTALTYCIDLFMPFLLSFNLITLIPLTFLIGSLAVNDLQEKRSFLHAKSMQWLGSISFCFYLIHFLVLRLLNEWTDGNQYNVIDAGLLIIAAGAVSLIAGWLLYQFIEQPVGNLLTAKKKQSVSNQVQESTPTS